MAIVLCSVWCISLYGCTGPPSGWQMFLSFHSCSAHSKKISFETCNMCRLDSCCRRRPQKSTHMTMNSLRWSSLYTAFRKLLKCLENKNTCRKPLCSIETWKAMGKKIENLLHWANHVIRTCFDPSLKRGGPAVKPVQRDKKPGTTALSVQIGSIACFSNTFS